LRARVAELDLQELRERLEDGEGRRTAAVLARKDADKRLDLLLEERRRAEEELADAAGRREEATATLYRIRSARERLALRRVTAPRGSALRTRTGHLRWPNVRVPPGSAASSCSRATPQSSFASCRSWRRRSCCARPFRPSHAKASASTRSAESSGSPVRRP